jgi:predicted alpha/beta-hydrolase family hydrolase
MASNRESPSTESLTLDIDGRTRVSALWMLPSDAHTVYVLAHGAGAGMKHAFMGAIANELAAVGVGTLRYQFPYAEANGKRPDPPEVCHATVRAAVTEAARRAPTLRLIAGGKSFGGRMTSQAQAIAPLTGVSGLAFLGFPLHPPKKPATDRAKHLFEVRVPMLFLQGTRDELADLVLLEPIVKELGERASLRQIEGADHSFHVLARSGRKDADVLRDLAREIAEWAISL